MPVLESSAEFQGGGNIPTGLIEGASTAAASTAPVSTAVSQDTTDVVAIQPSKSAAESSAAAVSSAVASSASTTQARNLLNGLSLGPLTSTFSAPGSCDTASTYSVNGLNAGFYQQGPYATDDGCLPSGWALNGFYSPGVCPNGYTVACQGTNGGVGTSICCPTFQSFSCATAIAYERFGCVSAFTPYITMTDVIGQGEASGTWDTVIGSEGAIWAYSVEVMMDVVVTTGTGSSATTMTGTATGGATSSSSPSSGGGLSGGAIAGIVIGVIAAVGLAALGAFLLWRRRRKTPGERHELSGMSMFSGKRWKSQSSGTPQIPQELPGSGGYEHRHELEEQRVPSELPG